jgi:hypothetical protein
MLRSGVIGIELRHEKLLKRRAAARRYPEVRIPRPESVPACGSVQCDSGGETAGGVDIGAAVLRIRRTFEAGQTSWHQEPPTTTQAFESVRRVDDSLACGISDQETYSRSLQR